jgi:hypothetical protein
VFWVARAAVVAGFHLPRSVRLVRPQQDRATLAVSELVLVLPADQAAAKVPQERLAVLVA